MLGRKCLRYVCVRLIVSVHLGWFLKHLTCRILGLVLEGCSSNIQVIWALGCFRYNIDA